ncbi:predicted protein [Histoplasma capsulatum G186AR]|uniref:Uncharacterized protein n=1 Tax=Ajellomyces capsulatus (strain G186AR / H82 / ATCC MYA-2454 / RMSCC 2432) TaxID=447093 RepID=C0NHM2_AJECG|nr:uncharacterized protein HCBG_02844 [Histoplasma capsulatum G186AR]EEH09307.1 predicted protein [Histoplasma capsulatum G186AR]
MGVKIRSSEPEVSKGVVSPRRVDIPEREFTFVCWGLRGQGIPGVLTRMQFWPTFGRSPRMSCRSVNVYMESNIVPIIVNSEMVPVKDIAAGNLWDGDRLGLRIDH